jgi:nucleotide-binding universal stress UspA family protein
VDGSQFAEQAVPLALSIAERARCKVKFVLVHRRHQPLFPLEERLDYLTQRLASKRSEGGYLRALVAPLRQQVGRQVSTAALEGPVASSVAEYVRDTGVDLVVMSSHGRGGLRRAWLGSVADELVRTVEVPVLLVRPTGGDPSNPLPPLEKVLVPLDGSARAEAILPGALALARLWNSQIKLVRVVHPIALSTRIAPALPSVDDDLTDRSCQAAQRYLDDMALSLRRQRVNASGMAVVSGWVADSILQVARSEGAGLIAVATRGRRGLRRFVLGSVADKLVRESEVPVLVHRHRAEGSTGGSPAA